MAQVSFTDSFFTAHSLACLLIDEKGKLQRKELFHALELLKNNLYSLSLEEEQEGSQMRHILALLQKFYDDPQYEQALIRIGRPLNHVVAEKMIRCTLLLSAKEPMSEAHARQAAFAALLTPLRQKVGSCFATAPAILVQQSEPLQFLADIAQLFGVGALKRVIAGQEHAMPLCMSPDLDVLKGWEYTLASFAEAKADCTKWNLYASLGLQAQEPHGIGECITRMLREKIERMNRVIEEHQSRYDHAFAHVQALEGRLRLAASENEMRWLQAEYQMRKHEINRVLSEQEEVHDKGRRLASLYSLLVQFYQERIPAYFQEIYDPKLHDEGANPYDDRPAGFRLLYKHGRTNTALWTWIYTPEEYLQALTSFFIATEVELAQREEMKGLQNEIGEIVTAIVLTIKEPHFLNGSFERLSRVYNQPHRTPWSYISGGSLQTLVSFYYGRAQAPTESHRWIESETELLVFWIDTLKELPLSVSRELNHPESALLAYSPTHAFLIKPNWPQFKEGWESDLYTYTWVRDVWAAPIHAFIDTLVLDRRAQEYLIEKLLAFIPEGYRPIVSQAVAPLTSLALTPPLFREHVLTILSYEKWLAQAFDFVAEEFDHILYHYLPLFPEHQLEEKLRTLFQAVDAIDTSLMKTLFACYQEAHLEKYNLLSSKDLLNITCSLLCLALQKTRTSIDYTAKIVSAMRETGLTFPAPLLCADTNWVCKRFGFTVNPGTKGIELWTFDELGIEGRPMRAWKNYLNGVSRKEWGIYIKPSEYSR